MTENCLPSAVDIVNGCREGHFTAEEILAVHVQRHLATHDSINALVQTRHTEAALEAEAITSALADRQSDWPLAGVPMSVKECFPVRNLHTTLGVPALRNNWDTSNAKIVQRLQETGALIVGKGNVPQAMFLHETCNPLFGRTLHPSDAQRSPGGSSGGDAALVAAGVVPLAVGTDLAGSIRQPANACGLVGLVPRAETFGDCGSHNTMPNLRLVQARTGLLGARVTDVRYVFDAILGRHSSSKRSPAGLRIGWFDTCGPIESVPAVRRAVHEAVAIVSKKGASVKKISSDLWEEAAWLLLAILSADGSRDIKALFEGEKPIPEVRHLLRIAGIPRYLRFLLAWMADLFGHRIESIALRATGPRCESDREALEEKQKIIIKQFTDLSESFDAILCPVSSLPAMRHGLAGRLVVAAIPCLAANLCDLPAGAVPVTKVRAYEEDYHHDNRDPVMRHVAYNQVGSSGLPVGVQVVSLKRDKCEGEDLVLDIMRCIEASVTGS
ncbi:MAG: amidase family protein [Pirellulales bacterium]